MGSSELERVQADLQRAGFAVVPTLLNHDEVTFWAKKFEAPVRAGRRNLLDEPDVRRLAESPTIRELVGDGKVVRGILFDKTSDANWAVPPHQDLNIALTERHDVSGYG